MTNPYEPPPETNQDDKLPSKPRKWIRKVVLFFALFVVLATVGSLANTGQGYWVTFVLYVLLGCVYLWQVRES
ncbi:hypothetical protein [Planctomycetes bacterium K23_9]|uniref:Uncharacterized protein n=1 Tax=Stieleria marina TaxID=1930275 RepID=A0A517NZ11_9BACT|nr:hypothetical protein K239x_43650 [Planctomycetes bacterium K23_9]